MRELWSLFYKGTNPSHALTNQAPPKDPLLIFCCHHIGSGFNMKVEDTDSQTIAPSHLPNHVDKPLLLRALPLMPRNLGTVFGNPQDLSAPLLPWRSTLLLMSTIWSTFCSSAVGFEQSHGPKPMQSPWTLLSLSHAQSVGLRSP